MMGKRCCLRGARPARLVAAACSPLCAAVTTHLMPHCRAAPQVERGSLFPAACISLYTMYLAYSALQSEPRDYECNALGQRLSAASATTLATGVLLTLCSVVYSAFRAGSNTRTFRCGGTRGPSGKRPRLSTAPPASICGFGCKWLPWRVGSWYLQLFAFVKHKGCPD